MRLLEWACSVLGGPNQEVRQSSRLAGAASYVVMCVGVGGVEGRLCVQREDLQARD